MILKDKLTSTIGGRPLNPTFRWFFILTVTNLDLVPFGTGTLTLTSWSDWVQEYFSKSKPLPLFWTVQVLKEYQPPKHIWGSNAHWRTSCAEKKGWNRFRGYTSRGAFVFVGVFDFRFLLFLQPLVGFFPLLLQNMSVKFTTRPHSHQQQQYHHQMLLETQSWCEREELWESETQPTRNPRFLCFFFSFFICFLYPLLTCLSHLFKSFLA